MHSHPFSLSYFKSIGFYYPDPNIGGAEAQRSADNAEEMHEPQRHGGHREKIKTAIQTNTLSTFGANAGFLQRAQRRADGAEEMQFPRINAD
jgi:hypothetical protein